MVGLALGRRQDQKVFRIQELNDILIIMIFPNSSVGSDWVVVQAPQARWTKYPPGPVEPVAAAKVTLVTHGYWVTDSHVTIRHYRDCHAIRHDTDHGFI